MDLLLFLTLTPEPCRAEVWAGLLRVITNAELVPGNQKAPYNVQSIF